MFYLLVLPHLRRIIAVAVLVTVIGVNAQTSCGQTTPNMFGDFFADSPTWTFVAPVIDYSESLVDHTMMGDVDLPLAFGGQRLRVSENFNVIPQQRVYAKFNHLHNAADASIVESGVGLIDRDRASGNFWTIGVELPFSHFGDSSLELRVPIYESISSGAVADFPGFSDTFRYESGGGSIGNVSLVLKHVLAQTEVATISCGLGVSLPTAKDTTVQVRRVSSVLQNETVDIAPWVGLLTTPTDRTFLQFFGQINVPLNGNSIYFTSGIDPNNVANSTPETGSFGDYNLQPLLSADIQAGFWLLKAPERRGLTGLASVVEFHYVTTLSDSDRTGGAAGALADISGSDTTFLFSSPLNRQDTLNFTIGLHAEINERMSIRIGEVFALTGPSERTIDSALLAQVNLEL